MRFSELLLKGAFCIEPEIFSDERGSFYRYFCKNDFQKINHSKEWVQMNHSITNKKGTLRGMHFQKPPFKEIKMVECIKGKIFDVIIDIRYDSPDFLKWIGIELSAENRKMLYIPEGFAHGFQTLEDNTELIYHHSEFYTPGFEAGLMYNDKMLNISWPIEVSILSERDKNHPELNQNFKGI